MFLKNLPKINVFFYGFCSVEQCTEISQKIAAFIWGSGKLSFVNTGGLKILYEQPNSNVSYCPLFLVLLVFHF